MTVYRVTTILLVAALLALSCAQDRTLHVQIDIEHALLTGSVLDPKDIQWSPRGTVSADLVRRGGQLELSAASMSNEVMSPSFRKELESCVSDPLLYAVRIGGKLSRDRSYVAPISTIPACRLLESGMEDSLSIHFDLDGAALALSYDTEAESCSLYPQPVSSSFVTTVGASFARAAKSAPTPTPAPTPLPPGVEPPKPEQGFLEKYWFYLVLGFIYIVVVNVVQGAAPGASGGGTRA